MLRRLMLLPLLAALWMPLAEAGQTAQAQRLVEQTTAAVLERLRAESSQLKADPSGIYALVEDLVLPHFDFERMSMWVLGKHWRTADAAQRSRFTDAFRTLLVRTYAVALLEYNDQELVFPATRMPEEANRIQVQSEIRQPGAPAIPLHYRLYDRNGEWMVYDISVDGVSLLVNYRTSFGSEVASKGIDGLIQQMEEMNSNGAGNG